MSSFADLASEIDASGAEPEKAQTFADLSNEIDSTVAKSDAPISEKKGYFARVRDAALAFDDSVKNEGITAAPKAAGETLVSMVTGGLVPLAKHGIAEGLYLRGESAGTGRALADQFIPKPIYEPESAGGKALTNLVGTIGQPLIDAGKWAAEKAGLSETAQDIAGDFAPVVIPQAAAKTAGIVKDAATGTVNGVKSAATGLNDRFQELQRVGRGEPPANTQPAAIVETVKELPPSAFTADMAPSIKPVDPSAQLSRADVLKRIGVPEDAVIRESALTGDAKMAKTDYQQSLADNPAGDLWAQKLASERQYLTDHAENIIKQTGGSVGNDGASLYSRGTTQLTPLTEMGDWFDKRIGDLYKAADERAQGQPVALNKFNDVLNGAENLTNSDRVHLQAATGSYIKKLGLDTENGVAGNVQQAETIRKYLNENWSPASNGFIKSLKNALDDDVTSAAGEDIYSAARQLRQQRGALLDNPKGVAKLMDSNGPNGINRAVDIEKIPQQIKSMPVDQLTHILDTLKNAPDEIQPSAQQALAEIKGQFANDVLDIGNKFKGQWNEKGVTDYLKQNREKLNRVFADSPEQLQQLKDLNDAGHIFKIDKTYPGAAIQTNNMMQRGALSSIGPAAATAGGAIGSVVPIPGATAIGTAIGGYAGNSLSKSLIEKSALKGAEARMVKLSDLVKKPR